MIIGLTGGIGSGKSTVSGYLSERGYPIVDADEISRNIAEPGSEVLPELAAVFGSGIIRDDGSLDRRLLADIVFPDPVKKKKMDEIMLSRILPMIRQKAEEEEKKQSLMPGAGPVFMDVPLLFETGLDKDCDKVWVVTADLEKRIERVAQRDGTDAEHVRARIRNQMSDEEKIARADHVLYNSGTKEELTEEIDELLKIYG